MAEKHFIGFNEVVNASMDKKKSYLIKMDGYGKVNVEEETIPLADIISQVSTIENLKTVTQDNTARINNLEDMDLKEMFLAALDLATIRSSFYNETEIIVEYGRNHITSAKVWILQQDGTYQLGGVEIINDSINKRVIIRSNVPVTGYAIIL